MYVKEDSLQGKKIRMGVVPSDSNGLGCDYYLYRFVYNNYHDCNVDRYDSVHCNWLHFMRNLHCWSTCF